MAVNKSVSRTSLRDPDSGVVAGVELISGKNRLLTSSVVTIEQLFGAYPFAGSWFRIENTGATGDTITLTIAATANDPSAPDRDVPLFVKVFTILAGEVGDEIALRDRIISELNSDNAFKVNFKARRVKSNAIVHIESKFRGEFYNRPTAGSFVTTFTGAALTTDGWSDFIARGKSNELAISEDDPRVGVLGISGSLQVQRGFRRFETALSDGVTGNMAVDGSGTPQVFTLDAVDGFDIFIDEIVIHGLDNGIKMANFLGQNSALTNGMDFEIKADDGTFSYSTIKSTREIKRFSTPGGWYLDVEAGGDDAMAIKALGNTPIPIRAMGSFATDDFFNVTINDNLNNVEELKVVVFGFRKEV